MAPLDVIDLQDKLPLDEELGLLLAPDQPLEEESRQCLYLHVAQAFNEGDTALRKTLLFRKEFWQSSSTTFEYLGEATPHIYSAEAFVRHNA